MRDHGTLYGWKPDPRLERQPERVMLHAEHLVLNHPVSGKELDLRAPIPRDFERVMKDLRRAAGGAAKSRSRA